MWCLARLLPLMIGEKIREEDPHWENFLILLTIVDYCFAPIVCEDWAAFLRMLINDHHIEFRKLYPACHLTPKMHYMVHLPDIMCKYVYMSFSIFGLILVEQLTSANFKLNCMLSTPINHCMCPLCIRYGPMVQFWCMRFEDKHNYFKDLAHRVKSFKNIPKTMAYRHQELACYYINSSGSNSPYCKENKAGPGLYCCFLIIYALHCIVVYI